MFQTGQQIGLYTLIRKLGKGGFGEVWLAERKSKFVTTKVAVKLPLDEQVDHEAIKQEATLWEQASGHPNVLPIIDADEYDGQIVIVSEYAPDGSLEKWLRENGKMPLEKAVEMTIKILDGLEFLHSRNIIHRDLKPANILLQGNTPRLADFGISRALRTTVSSQTSNVSGTFAYMPPEGFDGKRSTQTDIWAVGVNLYQLLTGNLPFPQKEPSMLIGAIITKEFELLPDYVPQNLRSIVTKALAKDVQNRYRNAYEMRDGLKRFLQGQNASEYIESNLPKTQASFPVSEIIPTHKNISLSAQPFSNKRETIVPDMPAFLQEKKKNSINWVFAIIGIFLGGAIAFGCYLLINQQGKSTEIENEFGQSVQPSNQNTQNENIITSNANVNLPSPTPTPTPMTYSGIYKYSKGKGFGTLKIKETGKPLSKSFGFSIETGIPGCVGQVEGIAKLKNDKTAISSIKNDNYDSTSEYDREYCQITFIFSGSKVSVKENGDGCMIYYGAMGCGFNGVYSK